MDPGRIPRPSHFWTGLTILGISVRERYVPFGQSEPQNLRNRLYPPAGRLGPPCMLSSAGTATAISRCSASGDHVTKHEDWCRADASKSQRRSHPSSCVNLYFVVLQNPMVILPLCMGTKCALKLWLSSVTQNLPQQVRQPLCRLYPLCFLVFRSIAQIEDPGHWDGEDPRVGYVSPGPLPRPSCRRTSRNPVAPYCPAC